MNNPSAIQTVLEVAKEHIQKCISAREIEAQDKGFAFTKKDAEIYELLLTIPVIRSIRKYLSESDVFSRVEVKRNTDLIQIEGIVVRGENSFHYETRIILAGGYNIQRLHHRYITVTNLPAVNEEGDAVKKIQGRILSLNKFARLQNDNVGYQRLLKRSEEELDKYSVINSLSFDSKVSVFDTEYYHNSDKRDRETPETKVDFVNARAKHYISLAKSDIRKYSKKIEKNLELIKELSA